MRKAPLSGADAAWLHMDREDNLMVVTGVLELATPLDFQALEGVIRKRLLPIARFTQRVVEPRFPLGSPRWERVPELDLSEHLVLLEPGPKGEQELKDAVSSLASQPLARDRPLWRLYFVPHYGEGSLLIVRVHHALADGFALLSVLLSLCDGKTSVNVPPPSVKQRWDVGKGPVASFAHLVASPVDPPTPFKGPLGVEKRVAWTRPFPLDAVKRAARRRDATLNDVLTSCVAGALRRYLAARKANTEVELHAMVPVNLRSREAALTQLGNRFGLLILALPVREHDPLARLEAVRRTMSRVKRSAEALVALGLLGVTGMVPVAVERLILSFFGAKASLVLTNVPGPAERLSLGGSEVSRILFWVPQAARLGLGISLISYAGQVIVEVMSDAGRVPDPQALVTGFEEELASL
jgi:hypothetical protein